MSRAILFKGKRKDNGEWVKGFVFEFKSKIYISEMTQTFITVYYTEESVADFNMRAYEIDPATLCQYTGLTDKNGKKIWENDIVKNKKRTEGFDWYKVVWRKDFADFGVEPIKPKFEAKYPMGLSDELTIYGRDYEVVGNVFDNPELLEVE